MHRIARNTIISSLAVAGATYVGWHWVAGPCESRGPGELLTVERQANVFTYNRQQAPSIDLDADGNALVVWGSRRQEGGTFGVFGRLVDGNGTPQGAELHINQEMDNNQEAPAVSFHGNSAWVAWQSWDQDGDAGAIVARRFGRDGDTFGALGDEMVINETVAGDQVQATVAHGGGSAMFAWTTETEDGAHIVMGRVLDANGQPLGGEFRLGDGTLVSEWLPVLTAQPDGFVASWAIRDREIGVPAGVLARRFDANGVALGAAFQVAGDTTAHTGRHDIEPAIDADADGRFVIAWLGTNPAGGYDVFARRYDTDGTALGAEFKVADRSEGIEWINAVAVAVADDGRFVVSYNEHVREGDQTAKDIIAHRYDATGASGERFRVNRNAEGRQSMTVSGARQVAWGAGDRLAFAWDGKTTEDGSGIGVTMMVPENATASTLTVDAAILSTAVMTDTHIGEILPPEFDPNHVPDKPEQVTLSPGQDFGFIGFTSTGWNPPDPDIAVGPNGILIAVNGGVRYYSKTGSQQWTRPLTGGSGFWAGQGSGNFVFDPVELYDPHTGRFVIACTEHFGSTDYLVIAVSNDSDPSGSSGYNDFIKFRWNVNSLCGFIDFPNLGVDEDAIYITTDCFESPGGNKAWIIDKAALLAGEDVFPEVVNMSSGFFSLGSTKSYDADPPAAYFVTAENGSSSAIRFKAIVDPLGARTVSTFDLSVPSYSSPPNAEQMGSSSTLATVGKRIKNAVYRNGSLWTTHTVAGGGAARVRWYEVAMNGWPTSGDDPTMVQNGTQNLGSNVDNWFADVDVDAQGNAGLAFNRSSPNEFVGVWRTFRLEGDLLNKLRTPEQMQSSTAPDSSGRWGDYGGIHQDPAQPNAFWNMHEYRTSSWRTWVGKFELPVEVCPEDLDGSGAVDFGDILAILAAWGNAGGPEDLDDSGTVDFADILVVLDAYGACP